MIEPQVVHGGASSWFWIAANCDASSSEQSRPVGLTFAVGVDGAFGAGTVGRLQRRSIASSRLLTPARNCASGDRNFDAIQRKM